MRHNSTLLPPQIPNTKQRQGSRYSAPFGQWIFKRPQRVVDIFDLSEIQNEEQNNQQFNFGDENFSLKTVFNHYFQKVSLYDIDSYYRKEDTHARRLWTFIYMTHYKSTPSRETTCRD